MDFVFYFIVSQAALILIHANTTYLLNIVCTMVDTRMILGRWEFQDFNKNVMSDNAFELGCNCVGCCVHEAK